MNRFFYPKLAVTSIKKNSKTYLPYILTCIFTVAMYYIMYFMSINEGLNKMPGSDSLKSILKLGTYVIALFSLIFLFYTNSFLIKRRKKEFGLFNILGMEKKHISKMLFFETLYIAVVSLILGILLGGLLSKLMYLLLLKLLHFDVPMGFEIPIPAITSTIILFVIIFVLILINALRQIHLTNPIELLKGGETGEKEPKTKWLLAILGMICISVGYYMSISIENPLTAISLFFVAVILVIIGTYCLFTAGSIAFLKMLRKNKKYYYKANHFTSVSGMIYRMKQNAVGLANICILSTMVLVMISTTVSMYIGMDDVVRTRYPRNIITYMESASSDDKNKINTIINEEITKANVKVSNTNYYSYLSHVAVQNENSFSGKKSTTLNSGAVGNDVASLNFIPISEYNKMQNTNATLNDNEVILYTDSGEISSNTIKVNNIELNIKEKIDNLNIVISQMSGIVDTYYIVLPNEKVLQNIESTFSEDNESFIGMSYFYGFDTLSNSESQIKLTKAIESKIKSANIKARVEGSEDSRESFFSIYGGLFFLGIFLGLLFIMATVLIMYYKQISEGYDDKKRFEIMQKIGMSKDEVKRSIKSQVITVFFIPIVTAGIHIVFAFNMISKLLALLNLYNVQLFAWCTLGTILVFGIFYAIVYSLTARIYYRIVS